MESFSMTTKESFSTTKESFSMTKESKEKCQCDMSMKIHKNPGHAYNVSEIDMTLDQFCAAFFHSSICYEWRNTRLCLNKHSKCTSHNVTLCVVGYLLEQETKQILIEKLYFNCFRGNTEKNIHAEEFFLQDEEMQNIIRENPNICLDFYITFQPCHFSAGGRAKRTHEKSCCNLLCQFKKENPGVKIFIKCSSIYRACWTDKEEYKCNSDVAIFVDRTENAREGIRLLTEHGFHLSALSQQDWVYLCKTFLKRYRPSVLTQETWRIRFENDVCIQKFLEQFHCDTGEQFHCDTGEQFHCKEQFKELRR